MNTMDDTDRVERLREPHRGKTEREAAAEIERLMAEHDDYVIRANANVCELNREIERLMAALETCRDLRRYDAAEIGRLREVGRSMGGTP